MPHSPQLGLSPSVAGRSRWATGTDWSLLSEALAGPAEQFTASGRWRRLSVHIGECMPNSKKKKPATRREYTRDDLKALKAHSKAKTPITKISKQLKRTVPALRAKAHQLGIGLGHQR
jgi:hypothetical protein